MSRAGYERHACDVLVLGAGGAGLRAAIGHFPKVNIVVRRVGEGLAIARAPLPEVPAKLRQLLAAR
jgi:succinate dehydrogenase/fumarate reductase flavoprotein subunit